MATSGPQVNSIKSSLIPDFYKPCQDGIDNQEWPKCTDKLSNSILTIISELQSVLPFTTPLVSFGLNETLSMMRKGLSTCVILSIPQVVFRGLYPMVPYFSALYSIPVVTIIQDSVAFGQFINKKSLQAMSINFQPSFSQSGDIAALPPLWAKLAPLYPELITKLTSQHQINLDKRAQICDKFASLLSFSLIFRSTWLQCQQSYLLERLFQELQHDVDTNKEIQHESTRRTPRIKTVAQKRPKQTAPSESAISDSDDTCKPIIKKQRVNTKGEMKAPESTSPFNPFISTSQPTTPLSTTNPQQESTQIEKIQQTRSNKPDLTKLNKAPTAKLDSNSNARNEKPIYDPFSILTTGFGAISTKTTKTTTNQTNKQKATEKIPLPLSQSAPSSKLNIHSTKGPQKTAYTPSTTPTPSSTQEILTPNLFSSLLRAPASSTPKTSGLSLSSFALGKKK